MHSWRRREERKGEGGRGGEKGEFEWLWLTHATKARILSFLGEKERLFTSKSLTHKYTHPRTHLYTHTHRERERGRGHHRAVSRTKTRERGDSEGGRGQTQKKHIWRDGKEGEREEREKREKREKREREGVWEERAWICFQGGEGG